MDKKRAASRWLSSPAHFFVFLTCLLCSSSTIVHAIAFGESDTRIREEDGTRTVVVRRQLSETSTLTLKALTLDDFITRNTDNVECSQLLTMFANLTQGEKAQYSDFVPSIREFTVTFAERETDKQISIEVVDDAVSEQEESFVLFIANEGGCNTLLVSIVDNDELRFKFQSSGVQQFQEGVDREGKVTVVKVGENEQDVVFTMKFVFASTGAASGQDVNFTPMDLVFSSNKSSTDVSFQIVDDTSPENQETFQICFPIILSDHPNVSLSRIEGSPCSTINIVDDDSLNIAFFNNTVSIQEGKGPLDVCFGVLQHGLRLTGNELVQLDITKSALVQGTEGELELVIRNLALYPTNEQECVQVTAVDDHLADGSHTILLSLDVSDEHFGLPVVFIQKNITIQVLDNDPIIFELVGPSEDFSQPVFIREGETRDDVLSIRKLGNATFSYNVTLNVHASNANGDVDFDIQKTSFIFDVTEDMFTISIEVIEDVVPEKLERFTVSIANITTVEESSGAIIRVGDVGSIEFAIYDNDFVIGFDMDPTTTSDVAGTTDTEVMEGKNSTFEISIFDLQSEDIDPRVMIAVTFLVNGVNQTDSYGFVVSPSVVVLNTTNSKSIPTIIALNDDQCLGERSYDLHVVLLTTNTSIEIANPVITVTLMDNDCLCVVCIVVPVVLVLLVVLVVLLILAAILLVYGKRHRWRNHIT